MPRNAELRTNPGTPNRGTTCSGPRFSQAAFHDATSSVNLRAFYSLDTPGSRERLSVPAIGWPQVPRQGHGSPLHRFAGPWVPTGLRRDQLAGQRFGRQSEADPGAQRPTLPRDRLAGCGCCIPDKQSSVLCALPGHPALPRRPRNHRCRHWHHRNWDERSASTCGNGVVCEDIPETGSPPAHASSAPESLRPRRHRFPSEHR